MSFMIMNKEYKFKIAMNSFRLLKIILVVELLGIQSCNGIGAFSSGYQKVSETPFLTTTGTPEKLTTDSPAKYTPTMVVKKATPTPTSTESPFQRLSALEKGEYILFEGREIKSDKNLLYVLDQKGKLQKVMEPGMELYLPEISYDQRYISFHIVDEVDILDLMSGKISFLGAGCDFTAWAPEQLSLAATCDDGIRIFHKENEQWKMVRKIPFPKIYKVFGEPASITIFPFWLVDGRISFFGNLSGYQPNDIVKELFVVSQKCIESPNFCEEDYLKINYEDGILPGSSVSISKDNRYLVVSKTVKDYRNIQVYDYWSGNIIQKISLPILDSNNRESAESVKWLSDPAKIVYLYSNKIYTQNIKNEDPAEMLFDCDKTNLISCSIIDLIKIP